MELMCCANAKCIGDKAFLHETSVARDKSMLYKVAGIAKICIQFVEDGLH